MKRWLIFFSSFICILALSFFTFIYFSRTRLIEAAITRNTQLTCTVGGITFGLKQQTIHDIICTLPDQSRLSISQVTLDLSMQRTLYWAVNPNQPLLYTGKWRASNVDFQVVAETPDFSKNGWKSWLESVRKQKGPIKVHSINLSDITLTVKNSALSGAALSPKPYSTDVIFAREPNSLQSILYEVVLTLLEDTSRQLGLTHLLPDENLQK